MPRAWEERVSLYCAYLVNNGAQSTTIKSYVSAIKCILKDDGYHWNNEKILLETITRSCRLMNDRVLTRLPIHENLLELILFEIGRLFETQPYLTLVYWMIMLLGYHGLLRIGELVATNSPSDHAVRACNIHVAHNKDKLMIVLYTSKTYGLESRPQKIRITANPVQAQAQHTLCNNVTSTIKYRHFCPFKLTREFMAIHGGYLNSNEPFFIFKSGIPISDSHMRFTLQSTLKRLWLDPTCYGCHSWRIGKASDMLKQGKSIISIKIAG